MKPSKPRIAVVDIGTLATRTGRPMPFGRDALQELCAWGWRIVVCASPGARPATVKWLHRHAIPAHAVHPTPPIAPNLDRPIGTVYFHARDAHVCNREPYDWFAAMRRVRRRYQPPLTVDIDDAAAWAHWTSRAFAALRKSRRWWRTQQLNG